MILETLVAAVVASAGSAGATAPGATEPAPLSKHRLPGFSVDLPAGTILEESTDYQAGRLMLKLAERAGSVAVVWQPGGASRDEIEAIARGLASSLGASGASRIETLPGPRGGSADTIVVDSGRQTIRMSMLNCGRRQLFVATFGGSGTEELHRHMLQTVACSPDPRLETEGIGVVPVKLELPGWSAIDRSDGHLLLSDGQSLLLLNSGVMSRTRFADLVDTAFKAMGVQLTVNPTGHDSATLTGTLEGIHVEGWARSLLCPGGGGVLLMMLGPDRHTADGVAELAAAARCTGPGEAPSTWPDAKRASP